MNVQDFEQEVEVKDRDELAAVVAKRYGELKLNEFWLCHDETYPALTMMVKGDLACVHYFPEEGHPGFQSQGEIAGLDPDGISLFAMGSIDQKQEVPNSSLIPFADSLRASEEFLVSPEPPSSFEWLEL